jgi:hypothetical protein
MEEITKKHPEIVFSIGDFGFWPRSQDVLKKMNQDLIERAHKNRSIEEHIIEMRNLIGYKTELPKFKYVKGGLKL